MSSQSDLRLVYITASSDAEAQAIGAALVERRLAACVNILPSMTSMYLWNGKIESRSECVVIAKTEQRLTDQVVEAVRELHADQVPCAMVLPVLGGNPGYLAWLHESVQG